MTYPSRRLRQEDDADECKDSKDNLKRDREAKLRFALVIRETIVYVKFPMSTERVKRYVV